MSLLNSVLEKVKHQRNLKDASIKIFKRNIERLADNKEIKDFEFLKDIEKINKIISLYKPETQNSILQSVNRVLEVVDEPELLNTYRDWYYKVHKGIKETFTDEKTDTQKENWIEWKDVLNKQKELEAKAFQTTNWTDILNAVVLGLYTYFEPRRNQDYLELYIVKRKLDNKLMKELNDITNKNFLLLNTQKGPLFIFNKFKTSKSFGRQEIYIENKKLEELLKLYWNYYPAKKQKFSPFLVNEVGEPLTAPNSITRILNKIFGKNVGASMLRHIYLTDKYGETYKDREITSKNMAHTVGTQQKYIKKNNQ